VVEAHHHGAQPAERRQIAPFGGTNFHALRHRRMMPHPEREKTRPRGARIFFVFEGAHLLNLRSG
jgi:hypothetical protein